MLTKMNVLVSLVFFVFVYFVSFFVYLRPHSSPNLQHNLLEDSAIESKVSEPEDIHSPLRFPLPLVRTREGALWPIDSGGPAEFVDLVFSSGPPFTDKVKLPASIKLDAADTSGSPGHGYEVLYGTFLIPAAKAAAEKKLPFKFLEIGLGCTMSYGPGISVKLWRHLFSFATAEIWEAEHDVKCTETARKNGKLAGINVLVGDQGDPETLDRWMSESGGSFDFVTDDGGHTNPQIANSFAKIWPHVNPGGYYVMEDIMAGRMNHFGYPQNGYTPMVDVIKDWIDQLIIPNIWDDQSPQSGKARERHPLPPGIKFILCAAKSCIIAKCAPGEIYAFCPGGIV